MFVSSTIALLAFLTATGGAEAQKLRTGNVEADRVLQGRPVPTPAPAPTEGRCSLVFVTSSTYNGNLGGLAGADQKCQSAADQSGLRGTYKAWLSTRDGTSPSNRFNVDRSSPFCGLDGTVIAPSWDGLVDGPDTIIGVTETYEAIPIPDWVGRPIAWTATTRIGEAGNRFRHEHLGDIDPYIFDCNGWTSDSPNVLGYLGFIGSIAKWTEDPLGVTHCVHHGHLYCFQQIDD